MVHKVEVDGTVRVSNPMTITGTTYERARTLLIGTTGEVYLDEDGRSRGEWTNTSYFGIHGVTIAGALHAGLFSNIYPFDLGWDSLHLNGSAEFRFKPADDFACDSIVFVGGPTIEVFTPVIMRGNTFRLIQQLSISYPGELLLDTDNGDQNVWRDVSSEVHAEIVTVEGTFHAGLLTFGVGWMTLEVGGQGWFTLQTSDIPVENITVRSPTGRMEVLTPLNIHGREDTNVTNLMIESGATVRLDAGNGDQNVWRDVSSEVHAEIVTVEGTFHAGLLTFGVGWMTLEVGGQGWFTLQTSDIPVENITVRSPTGRMEVLTPLNIHGREDTNVTNLMIESGATVRLDAGNYAGTNLTNLTFSTILIDFLTIGGNFYANKLSFTITETTVSGLFSFYASTNEEIDLLTVSSGGQVLVVNSVTFLGRSSNRTHTVHIGGSMKLDTAAGDHSKQAWSSNVSSVLHLDHLIVNGALEAGFLSVGDGWQRFSVGDHGTVTFQPDATYRIDSITIAGQVTSFAPMPSTAPLISNSLLIYSTAFLDIDFRGLPADPSDGATNSSLHVGTIRIIDSGTLRAGSLWIETDQISIDNTGVLTVDGGGYLSDEGPGKLCFIFGFHI